MWACTAPVGPTFRHRHTAAQHNNAQYVMLKVRSDVASQHYCDDGIDYAILSDELPHACRWICVCACSVDGNCSINIYTHAPTNSICMFIDLRKYADSNYVKCNDNSATQRERQRDSQTQIDTGEHKQVWYNSSCLHMHAHTRVILSSHMQFKLKSTL